MDADTAGHLRAWSLLSQGVSLTEQGVTDDDGSAPGVLLDWLLQIQRVVNKEAANHG